MADPYPYDPRMVRFVAWALTPPDSVCHCGGEATECCAVCTELAMQAINAMDRWRLYRVVGIVGGDGD